MAPEDSRLQFRDGDGTCHIGAIAHAVRGDSTCHIGAISHAVRGDGTRYIRATRTIKTAGG